MEEDEDEDKQYEPSQKKLEDARKKGEVPMSADLGAAAAYAGLLLVAASMGGTTLLAFATQMKVILDQSDTLAIVMFDGQSSPITGGILAEMSSALAFWFLLPAIVVILAFLAQNSFLFASEKVTPKLSRISLIKNFQNKFGRNGFFEFGKSTFKLIIISAAMVYFFISNIEEILGTMALAPAMGTRVLLELSRSFLLLVLVIAISIGAVDFLWQQAEHIRKNRMSRKEMTDEAKESEGDPYLKQERRQRGYDIAMNQMLSDVPTADVVIVNPIHYAVALKWTREPGRAPVCVAKGVDEIAARIREIANDASIAIHEDPPTARALFATVDIGAEIGIDQYAQVAAAIRFAESLRTAEK
jgi:flagellar biosynthetic protein FlhB